ncbi:HAD family hydrolase [[Eubacterium] cellulosolvens]
MINTIILDIEGTLTTAQPTPCKPNQALRIKLHTLQRSGVTIILCSGRELDFIQRFKAIWEITPGSPVIAEDGCVVFDGEAEHITFDPSTYTPEKIKEDILTLGIKTLAEFDPAKRYMVTLYPLSFLACQKVTHTQVQEIYDRVVHLSDKYDVDLTHSSASVDFLPKDVDKLYGLKALVQRVKSIDLAKCLYIGDSKNDLEIGKYVRASGGKFCVPQNALPELKHAANYVAALEFDEGVLEIFDEYGI